MQLPLTQVLLLDVGELIGQPLVFTSVLAHPAVQHSHLCRQRLQTKLRVDRGLRLCVNVAHFRSLQVEEEQQHLMV